MVNNSVIVWDDFEKRQMNLTAMPKSLSSVLLLIYDVQKNSNKFSPE